MTFIKCFKYFFNSSLESLINGIFDNQVMLLSYHDLEVLYHRIMYYNSIAFKKVNFMIIASKVHLLFHYWCTCYIVNKSIKIMKFKLFRCQHFYFFKLYKNGYFYFMIIFYNFTTIYFCWQLYAFLVLLLAGL